MPSQVDLRKPSNQKLQLQTLFSRNITIYILILDRLDMSKQIEVTMASAINAQIRQLVAEQL